MKRATWLDLFASPDKGARDLAAHVRNALSLLDDALFELWNLGENVFLAWTHTDNELSFLCVRHYTIAAAVRPGPARVAGSVTSELINEVLAGPKYLEPDRFAKVCREVGAQPQRMPLTFRVGSDVEAGLIDNLVGRYGVSLVRGRAVVLLDAVQFSLQPPLDQMAMLNSLAYSVNSAYRQLLSKDIQVNFARTTTGDGFYIWNRARTPEANIALYKLMMMILADNAVAQSKSAGSGVPRLRAAFHVGEHYEFHQVEALNPTTFSYIVGQVTIDLSRMIEKALPGQILLGDFETDVMDALGQASRHGTLDFVENTAATLDELKGLDISGDRIDEIRCYLTGQSIGGDRYPVNRYHIRDKHGTLRTVYNAKINIHREHAEPIFLGVQREALADFAADQVEVMRRDAA